ncbi:hypothetical protein [Komagataeibacter xylinus]|uniref:hypothetical protein n=1 Tax=Komagataeibacter xylinus TaxID=28448 RepID=UPI00280A84DC|nr:hypothetical protein [Komagataeibacter xylinus]
MNWLSLRSVTDLFHRDVSCPQAPEPPRGPRIAAALLALALTAAAVLCLSGCATPPVRPVCLPLKTYSAADQTALRTELDAHTDTPVTHRVVGDYMGMRDADRVCLKAAQS